MGGLGEDWALDWAKTQGPWLIQGFPDIGRCGRLAGCVVVMVEHGCGQGADV